MKVVENESKSTVGTVLKKKKKKERKKEEGTWVRLEKITIFVFW
jgi:hypothetical protein